MRRPLSHGSMIRLHGSDLPLQHREPVWAHGSAAHPHTHTTATTEPAWAHGSAAHTHNHHRTSWAHGSAAHTLTQQPPQNPWAHGSAAHTHTPATTEPSWAHGSAAHPNGPALCFVGAQTLETKNTFV